MSGTVLTMGLSLIYLVAMIVIGVLASRMVKNSDDYMMSGRQLSWFTLAGGMAAMQLAGTTIAGYPGTAYNQGWGNLWGAWGWVLSAVVFLFLFAKFSRRTAAFTLVEWFKAKFGETTSTILAVGMIIALLFGGMAQFVGCANVVVGWTGISYSTAVVVLLACTVLYMYIGGYWATMIIDSIQFVLAALIIYVGVPAFLLIKYGGFSYLTTSPTPVPQEMLRFPFGTSTIFSFTLASVLGLVMNNFSFMLANSYYWSKTTAARSERAGFKGIAVAAAFVVPFGVVTTLAGLYARATFPGVEVSDQVFGLLLGDMPALLSALVMVGVLAATQSTAGAILFGISSIITKDLVPKVAPKANQLRVGRVMITVVGLAVGALALGFKQGALYGLAMMGTFVVPALPPLICTVLLPNWITKEGASCAMLCGIAAGIYWHFFTTLWQTHVHTMWITLIVSLTVMIITTLISRATGPWWQSGQDRNRKKAQADFGGMAAAAMQSPAEAQSAPARKAYTQREIFLELSKPLIKIKPFIRLVEKRAVRKNPEYISILKEVDPV